MTITGSNNQDILRPETVSEQSIVEILLELEATGEISARTYNEAIKAIKDKATGTENRIQITDLVRQLVTAISLKTEATEETPALVNARKALKAKVSQLAGVAVLPERQGEAPLETSGTPEISAEGDIINNISTSTNKEIGNLLGMMLAMKNNMEMQPAARAARTEAINRQLDVNIRELKTLLEADKRLNKSRKKGPQQAQERKRIDDALNNIILEHRKLTNGISQEINTEAARKLEMKRLNRFVGFDLTEGNQLRVKDKRKKLEQISIQGGKKVWIEKKKPGSSTDTTDDYIYENIYRRAVIKRVYYEDLAYTDESGNKVSIPSPSPMIEVEFIDETADERGVKNKSTELYPAATLRTIADNLAVTEIIEHRQDTPDTNEEMDRLAQLIGMNIAAGDTLEYDNGKTVAVVGFNKAQDDHTGQGSKTFIRLSNPVATTTEPVMELKNELSIEEFARWYKRVNASPSMDLAMMRQYLQQDFAARMRSYPGRDPNQYPAINGEEGEMLYYDIDKDNPPAFVIEKVSEKGIKLDNHEILTPAAFFKWVRDNEVEKKTVDSMTARTMAALTQGPNPTPPTQINNVEEIAKAAAAKKLEEEKAKRKDENAVLPTTKDLPPQSINFLRKIYNETYFLSGGDLYEIGKEIYEFIQRQMTRRGKERVGKAGEWMLSPIYRQLGAEFQTMVQSAETENMNRYKEQYGNFGVFQIYDRMSKTNSRDEFKAIMYVLAEKGAIRWDDPTLLNAMNRIGMSQPNYIHISNYSEELIGKNLDAWWGEQTFNELKAKNNSGYGSVKSSFQEEARRIENDPEGKGGMKVKIQELLYRHINGDWVDPAEYEAYLHYAIEMGKLSFADKIFFIYMGLGAYSPSDKAYSSKPLLNFGRISDMQGTLLNKFPILDYFTSTKLPKYDENGNRIKDESGQLQDSLMNVNYVQQIMREYITGQMGPIDSATKLSPPSSFTTFVERKMMMNDTVMVRLAEKASRDMANWDHDDFHMYACRLGETQIEGIGLRTGASQQSSVAGLKNAYVGFNNYTNIFLEEFLKSQKGGNQEESQKNLVGLVNTLRSFVRMDAVLDGRLHSGAHERVRIGNELNSFAGVDGEGTRTVNTFNNEMKQFIHGIIRGMQGVSSAQLASVNADPDFFKNLEDTWHVVNTQYSSTQTTEIQKQADAVKHFGRDFSQGLFILQQIMGNEGIAAMLTSIQYGPDGKTKLVKGLRVKADRSAEEQSDTQYNLETITQSDLDDKVTQIQRLQQDLVSGGSKTPAQIEAEKDARTEAVIQAIDSGNIKGLTADDLALLDRRITSLTNQLVGR